jgi:hypothetical protein
MSRIRVDPPLLVQLSERITSAANNVSSAGAQTAGATADAPSYDGQFGPQVAAMASELGGLAGRVASDLAEMGERARNKALEFQTADELALLGVAGLGVYLGTQLSPSDLEEAMRVIALAYDSRDAQPIIDWLKAHPDLRDQDQFFDLMFQFGPVASEILDHSNLLSDEDRLLLASALDHAYRSGAVTADALRESIVAGGYGAPLGANHIALAELLGLTKNNDLISVYAAREIEILQDYPENGVRAQGVAIALSCLTPRALQAFLKSHEDGVEAAIGLINADWQASYSPALARLLDATMAIQPPTHEALNVFDHAIAQIEGNQYSRTAAAAFFDKNFDSVVRFYQADSGPLGHDGQQKLSVLFARTLFTKPAYEGQDAHQAFLAQKLGNLTDTLNRYATENSPSLYAQRQARLLGGLVGTIEGGFQISVDELNQRNEAVEKMVGLVFKVGELAPVGGIPGHAFVASLPGYGLIKDLTVDQVKQWVVDSLQEHAKDATEAIPFDTLFGEKIRNPILATDYDAARAATFVNRGVGLVK